MNSKNYWNKYIYEVEDVSTQFQSGNKLSIKQLSPKFIDKISSKEN
jgi:hypothetical protein